MQSISRRTFLAFTAGAAIRPPVWATETKVAGFPALLDHILLGCSDLDRGIAFVEEHTGVRAAFGGVHPGRGTQNALLSLSGVLKEPSARCYLEIIAPDPKQSGVQQYSVISKLKEPRLIGWAAHLGWAADLHDFDQFAARLRKEGIEFDGPQPGSRQRPDGKVLHWKALRLKDDHGGLLPFFIDWSADTTHPSLDAPQGCHLESFELLTPDPDALAKTADQLGLVVSISKAPESQIRAVLRYGRKELKLTS